MTDPRGGPESIGPCQSTEIVMHIPLSLPQCPGYDAVLVIIFIQAKQGVGDTMTCELKFKYDNITSNLLFYRH